MTKTLKLVNEIIASAESDLYDNVSYETYFKNLTKISNSIIDERNEMTLQKSLLEINNKAREKDLRSKFFMEINKLSSSKEKDALFSLLNIYF